MGAAILITVLMTAAAVASFGVWWLLRQQQVAAAAASRSRSGGQDRRSVEACRQSTPEDDEERTAYLSMAEIESVPLMHPVGEPTEFISTDSLPFMRRRAADYPGFRPSGPPEEVTEFLAMTELGATAESALPLAVDDRRPDPQPVSSGLTAEELAPQLVAGCREFERWCRSSPSNQRELQALATGPELALRRALQVLATANDQASQQILETTLDNPESEKAERKLAGLALLLRDGRSGLARLDALIEGDARAAADVRELLTLWSDRQADWQLQQRALRAGPTQSFWLDVLEARRVDPGAALLEELLASDDSELRRRGLVLAKYHDDPGLRCEVARRHLHDLRRPQVRMAAVELAIFDREPIAWMLCRQLAMSPDCVRAVELLASLGTAAELEPLLRRASGRGGALTWRICMSGRKRAAELAAAALERDREDVFAASGLRYVVGNPDQDGVDALLQRWAELKGTLTDDRRHLHGSRFGARPGLRACMAGADALHRRALGDELLFRSRGSCRWVGAGLAGDRLTALDDLDRVDIDFDEGFGGG